MSGLIPSKSFGVPGIYAKPKKVRDRVYKVISSFLSENPNINADVGDIVYTNIGDNNFYLEKVKIGESHPVSYVLDWSFGLKAVRYGWLELMKVEKPTPEP